MAERHYQLPALGMSPAQGGWHVPVTGACLCLWVAGLGDTGVLFRSFFTLKVNISVDEVREDQALV